MCLVSISSWYFESIWLEYTKSDDDRHHVSHIAWVVGKTKVRGPVIEPVWGSAFNQLTKVSATCNTHCNTFFQSHRKPRSREDVVDGPSQCIFKVTGSLTRIKRVNGSDSICEPNLTPLIGRSTIVFTKDLVPLHSSIMASSPLCYGAAPLPTGAINNRNNGSERCYESHTLDGNRVQWEGKQMELLWKNQGGAFGI